MSSTKVRNFVAKTMEPEPRLKTDQQCFAASQKPKPKAESQLYFQEKSIAESQLYKNLFTRNLS